MEALLQPGASRDKDLGRERVAGVAGGCRVPLTEVGHVVAALHRVPLGTPTPQLLHPGRDFGCQRRLPRAVCASLSTPGRNNTAIRFVSQLLATSVCSPCTWVHGFRDARDALAPAPVLGCGCSLWERVLLAARALGISCSSNTPICLLFQQGDGGWAAKT